MKKYTRQIRKAELAFILGAITQQEMEALIGTTLEEHFKVWDSAGWNFEDEDEAEPTPEGAYNDN